MRFRCVVAARGSSFAPYLTQDAQSVVPFLAVFAYPIAQWSKDPALAPAQRIIVNLRKRRLYRFVDELLLPVDWTYKVREHALQMRRSVRSCVN